MTLLEPEMLMMAVQSGKLRASADLFAVGFVKKSLDMFVVGLDRNGEENEA